MWDELPPGRKAPCRIVGWAPSWAEFWQCGISNEAQADMDETPSVHGAGVRGMRHDATVAAWDGMEWYIGVLGAVCGRV